MKRYSKFEYGNKQYFVKCCRMRNSTNFENYCCRWNNATFGKSTVVGEIVQCLKNADVGETIQHLAKLLLKVCVSSRIITLWKNISLTYKLSIQNSEKYIRKVYTLHTKLRISSSLHSSFYPSYANLSICWIILSIPVYKL